MGVVLVAGRPKELSALAYDAFSVRHRGIVQTILREHEVHVVQLAQRAEDIVADPDVPRASSVRTVRTTSAPNSRLDRIRHMTAGIWEPRLLAWEHELIEIAAATGAHAAVTFGPWLGEELRAIHRQLPAIHFFEEDLLRMPEIAPQSAQARLLRSASRWALGHRADQPRTVVAISGQELRAASSTYPRAKGVLLPLTLEPRSWPLADAPSCGAAVVVVGVLAEARNAEGLAAVLERVRSRGLGGELTFRLVTASGTHPMLDEYLTEAWIDAGPERGPIYGEYRRARCALVPAFRSTGMKSTILQAWAAGCPVVCSDVSAPGVGEQVPNALLAAPDAEGIVDALVRLGHDDPLRHRLAERGFVRLRADFDRGAHDDRLLGLVRELVGSAAVPAGGSAR